jgi:hypothetical protein
MKQTIFVTSKSALFILILSLIAWVSGTAFIFPSLGPTAYVLAFDRRLSHTPKVVIGGHACGVVGGLISYHLLVNPLELAMITEPLSSAALYIGLGAVFAIALTAFLMLTFQVSHPPACATTLIISLGILPTWLDGLIIMAAVVILYLSYWIFQKLN